MRRDQNKHNPYSKKMCLTKHKKTVEMKATKKRVNKNVYR